MSSLDTNWRPPRIRTDEVRIGDMPGDQVKIDQNHIRRARALFPSILNFIKESLQDKIVVSVYGGSGVGKSEIGSLLAYYCKLEGYPSYVLSGDNYPRRIPAQNDAERLNTYRSSGLAALAELKSFRNEWEAEIHACWDRMEDADPARRDKNEGFRAYQDAGSAALRNYLGTEKEIDFSLINSIIRRFKRGEAAIPLKRMGRSPDDIHFENVDFRGIKILVIEWTHGNNPAVEGVDYPVFLYSSPEETLAHRRSRGRDAGVDSSFTNLILQIEQFRLNRQAEKAALIIGKDAEIISLKEFLREQNND